MKTKVAIILISVWTIAFTCKFSAVDYAVGDVQLSKKHPIEVEGRPALELEIVNQGEEAAFDILVTIKAKKRQRVLQAKTVSLDELAANRRASRIVVFESLQDHSDYDLLTYAVSFSN